MLTPADCARALNVPCPLIACSAFIGEDCISAVSGWTVAPHPPRLVQAGVIAPPQPTPTDLEEAS